MPEGFKQFDFTKKEDVEKFDRLSKNKKKVLVDAAETEACYINDGLKEGRFENQEEGIKDLEKERERLEKYIDWYGRKIDVAKLLDEFSGLNHTEIALKLIEVELGELVLENLHLLNSSNQIIYEKLVDKGFAWLLAKTQYAQRNEFKEALDADKFDFENFRKLVSKILFYEKDKKQRKIILKSVKKEDRYNNANIIHRTEKAFMMSAKNNADKSGKVDNFKSLLKMRRYYLYLESIVGKGSDIAWTYMHLHQSLHRIKEDHPAIYSAFMENIIDISDFRHTAKIYGCEEDRDAISKVINMTWEPLFLCSAPATQWLSYSTIVDGEMNKGGCKKSQEKPVIFFDNKMVLEKIFEKYETKNISGFIDEEIKEERDVLAQMRVGFEGAKAVRPFYKNKEEYRDRFYVPRGWKMIFNGHMLLRMQALLGIVPMRLHDDKNGKYEENFSRLKFRSALEEMTDQKISLDEIQEQIDKEFMYRADAKTTISPLIMDNSFIRAIYLNGKIYNNKGEVILEEKAKE